MDEHENFPAREILMKRSVKDSVFTDLFSDKKYTLELYRALHPEDENVTEQDINIVTLENIMLNQPYNDLVFMVGNRLMILVEAQSTWSVNILVRGLIYMAQTIGEHIEKTEQSPYGSKKLSIPSPEFYVIYTGDRKERPKELTLTDEFFGGRKCSIDATVKMIYGGENGDIISQYVTFAKVLNGEVQKYGRTKKAIVETIKICRDKNVLKAYLESKGREVTNIMLDLFNQEAQLKRYVKCCVADREEEILGIGREEGIGIGRGIGREEGIGIGREEGIGIGREEGMVLSIRNLMKSLKLTAPQAMDALQIPVGEREKYAVLI